LGRGTLAGSWLGQGWGGGAWGGVCEGRARGGRGLRRTGVGGDRGSCECWAGAFQRSIRWTDDIPGSTSAGRGGGVGTGGKEAWQQRGGTGRGWWGLGQGDGIRGEAGGGRVKDQWGGGGGGGCGGGGWGGLGGGGGVRGGRWLTSPTAYQGSKTSHSKKTRQNTNKARQDEVTKQ